MTQEYKDLSKTIYFLPSLVIIHPYKATVTQASEKTVPIQREYLTKFREITKTFMSLKREVSGLLSGSWVLN